MIDPMLTAEGRQRAQALRSIYGEGSHISPGLRAAVDHLTAAVVLVEDGEAQGVPAGAILRAVLLKLRVAGLSASMGLTHESRTTS